MKKGIVMKINKNYITVLSQTGQFEKIKPKPNAEVGQQIFYFKNDRYNDRYNLINKKMFRLTSVAAAFMIVFTLFVLLQYNNLFVNAETYAIVTVDINPSIEMAVDKDNKVLSVKSLNEDGKKIISKTVVGKRLNEAIDYILQNAQENGFLLKQGSVLIATAIVAEDIIQTDINGSLEGAIAMDSENDYIEDNNDVENETDSNNDNNKDDDILNNAKSEENTEDAKLANNINKMNDNSLETFVNQYIQNKTGEYSFVYIKSSSEALKSANSQGLSLGKYEILKYLSSDVTQEDIKEMKVADIVKRKDFKENAKNKNDSLNLVNNNEKDLDENTKLVLGDEDSNQTSDDINSESNQNNGENNSDSNSNNGNAFGKQIDNGQNPASNKESSSLEQGNNLEQGNSSNSKKGQTEAANTTDSTGQQEEKGNINSNKEENQEQNENYNSEGKVKEKESNNNNEKVKVKEQQQGKQLNETDNDIENDLENQYTNNIQDEEEYYLEYNNKKYNENGNNNYEGSN